MTTGNVTPDTIALYWYTRFTCRLRQQNSLVRADYDIKNMQELFLFFLQMNDIYGGAEMQCLE